MSNSDYTAPPTPKELDSFAIHPAAAAFPLLDDKRLAELTDDIATHGLLHPIVLDPQGRILDGRNRTIACKRAGVEIRTVTTDGNPWALVWSQNAQRRDLEAGQRVLIWLKVQQGSEAWETARRERQEEANRKRAEAASEVAQQREREEDGTFQPGHVSRDTRPGPDESRNWERVSVAEATGVGEATAGRALALMNKAPDLAGEVAEGKLSLSAATREAKRREVVEQLEDVAAKEVKAAAGVYDVIVIDPPWPLEKIERDERPMQVGFDYPTMTAEELHDLDIPAADDCHLWLWTTHKHLPSAFSLLGHWGFRYVCTFVWHKPGGFQPVGLPQYNCEFALYARRGAPIFVDTKALPVCFDAPRGRHSEKPDAFYDVVRRVTVGRRLDMFNRRFIEGFDGWGNEARDD